MKTTRAGLLLLSLLLFCSFAALPADSAEMPERPAAKAGAFYPGNPEKLEAAVRAYLEEAVPPEGGRPLALVVPHAGYIYSGQIAADAYRQAMEHEYDLVVILGTNHTRGAFRGVSIYPGGGYRTPLGLAPIDAEVAAKLTAADEAFSFDPAVHAQEHSVEVQVPFLQVALPDAKIVTAVVGQADPALCKKFGNVLAEVLKGRKALIVASADLSHYPGYDDAVAADRATLEAIASLDASRLSVSIDHQLQKRRKNLSTCACGEAPVRAAMAAARALGAGPGRVISYANSGDTAMANRDRVVGYGAVVFTTEEQPAAKRKKPAPADDPRSDEAPLTEKHRKAMLEFARASIVRYFDTETAPLARDYPAQLGRVRGVFVTLNKHGRLRGCRGMNRPVLPLYQGIGAMALQAAFNDSRFTPLRREELEQIEIEISILSPLQEVDGPEQIVPGRDGVLLVKDGRSAIYLPQVATEQGWNREQMLDHLSQKAGLPAGAWRSGTTFHTFQADVFGEPEG